MPNRPLLIMMVFLIMLISCRPAQDLEPQITLTTADISSTSEQVTPTASITGKATLTATIAPTDTTQPVATLTPTLTQTPNPVQITKNNINQLELLQTLGEISPFTYIYDLIHGPGNQQLAIAGNPLVIFDSETLEIIHDYGEGFDPRYSHDGEFLLISRPDHSLEAWDANTQQLARTFRGHEGFILALSWSPVDHQFASYGEEGLLKIWSVDSEIPIDEYEIPIDNSFWWDIITLQWSPDGNKLAMTGVDNFLRVIEDGMMIEIEVGSEIVSDAQWSPDGSFLATSSLENPNVIIWRSSNLNRVQDFVNHVFWVSNVEWSPDGKFLATADAAGTLFVRDTNSGSIVQTFPHDYSPEYISWSDDGTRIAGIFDDIRVYEIEPRAEVEYPADLLPGIKKFVWVPGSPNLVVLNRDNRVQIWDNSTGDTEMLINPDIGNVSELSYSPDGMKMAVLESGGAIRILDVRDGEILQSIQNFNAGPGEFAWSPGADEVAVTGCNEDQICIFNSATGEINNNFGEGMRSAHLDWSSDASKIITGNWNGDILLWDPDSGEILTRFGHHDSQISDVSFSPDGSLAASIDRQGNIFIWEVDTGKRIDYLNPPLQNAAVDLAWSPDGSEIALLEVEFSETPTSELHILNAQTLEISGSYNMGEWVNQSYWSPDGEMIALRNGDILDPRNGDILLSLESRGILGWSPDGLFVVNLNDGIQMYGIIQQD